MAIIRFDAMPGLKPARRTDSGALVVQGFATRAGVFLYRNDDGTTRREFRPPEEAARVDGMHLIPLTLGHPPEGLVSPSNSQLLSVGSVANPTYMENHHVRVDIAIHAEDAILAAENGIEQLSLGYEITRLDAEQGEWNGQKYDFIQRGIKPNHLALVKAGRAGEAARIRLDGALYSCESLDAQTSRVSAQPEQPAMEKKLVRLDGQDVEVPADVAGRISAAIDKMQARLDAATEENAKLRKDADPANIVRIANARASLLADARRVLGDDAKRLDAVVDDTEIRVAVLKKLKPSLDLAGRSADYIASRFDAALEDHTAAGESHLKAAGSAQPRADEKDIVAEARARRDAALKEWK
jgi:hypothetical protein